MLGRAIQAVMVDLLASRDFNQSDWYLFHTLACRLQPQAKADCVHQPASLIAALGFDSVDAFVTGPAKRGGLNVSPERWEAINKAAASIEQAPWMAGAGYSMLTLANYQTMSITSGLELPFNQDAIAKFLEAYRVAVPSD